MCRHFLTKLVEEYSEYQSINVEFLENKIRKKAVIKICADSHVSIVVYLTKIIAVMSKQIFFILTSKQEFFFHKL